MIIGAKLASDRASIARQKMVEKRRERVLALRIAGLTGVQIANRLGVSERTIDRDLNALAETQADIETIIVDEGIDAEDAWVTLSRMHDADVADLLEYVPCEHGKETRCEFCKDSTREWTGSYLPPNKWPQVWRQGLAGEIIVEDVHDFEPGKSKFWDKTGKRIKIKRESLLKIVELAGKLKSVGAFPVVGEKLGEGMEALASSIDNAIAEGRRRAAQRVIEVKAEE